MASRVVERFRAYDGVELGYERVGAGAPLVCLPGGPGEHPDYLGDLGGLAAHRALVVPHLRGVGESPAPADPATYRVDRLVDDVEALCEHRGAGPVDLLGHSAGGSLALLHAARHPGRLRRLVLVTPSLRVTGLPYDTGADALIEARSGEPWYAEAVAALHAGPTDPDHLDALMAASAPLTYGRWDDAARAHASAARYAHGARAGFYAGPPPDTGDLRRRWAALDVPVLVLAGERDIAPTAVCARGLADLFPRGELVVQPGAGHFPWVDDPAAFARIVAGFLDPA